MSRVVLGKAALPCLETDVKPRVSFTRQPCGWKDSVGSPGTGALAAKHLTPVPHFPQSLNAFCVVTGLVAEKVALS